MLRTAIVAALLMGGAYYLYDSRSTYSRVVDRPPDEVARGLADLDITEQPGSPGTDPGRAGGVMPMITHRRTSEGVSWTVMSGKDVAVTMTALLTPIDDGKHTQVTTRVERGNARDDFVSPAFRSEALAGSLFAMALEDELNELVEPMTGDYAACERLKQRFEVANYAAADLQEKDSFRDAAADVSKTVIRLNAFDAESRRLGCNKLRDSGFQKMLEADRKQADRFADDGEAGGGWGPR